MKAESPQSASFLLEIGVEELPAVDAIAAVRQAGDLARSALSAARLPVNEEDVAVWVTPRRIAVYVKGVPAAQAAEEVSERGPLMKVAFDEKGEPTKAAAGFARAKNVAVEELTVRGHEGQEFVFAVRRQEGRPAAEVLPELCRGLIHSFAFPRTMRWDGSDLRFPRPVRWLVAKYGELTLPFAAAGLESGDTSRGHRFLSGGEVHITAADQYQQAMMEAGVIVDQQERRRIITQGLDEEAAGRGATWADPGGKIEEVIYLTEQPGVLAGSFAEDFLRLPPRVLVTAMQSHQRYFPLMGANGTLMAGFLCVTNSAPGAASLITEGNERILAGRLDDAAFSYDRDVETGIEEMAGRLDRVVFHQRLGTLAAKAERLGRLLPEIAALVGLPAEEMEAAGAAARLAKADQVSVMVQEFADLEGYIGSVYASMAGYPEAVCQAVAQHFLPTASEGELPQSHLGAALAVCDKADSIIGAFAVDEVPSGSRDPYGLRRAALGIYEIAVRFDLDFDLKDFFRLAWRLYSEQGADLALDESVCEQAYGFVCDRIQHRLAEQGMPGELMEAARAAAINSPVRLVALAKALERFRFEPEFESLHTAFFRCSKIAAKAGEEAVANPDPALFEEEAERELFESLKVLAPAVADLAARGGWQEALKLAAGIRPAVDRFFDDVLVMAPDEAVKRNRLALVRRAAGVMLVLGDPMRVAAAPRPGAGEGVA